jgi:hypothetical protein
MLPCPTHLHAPFLPIAMLLTFLFPMIPRLDALTVVSDNTDATDILELSRVLVVMLEC